MKVEKTTNDFVPNFNGTILENHFILLNKPETKLSTPSILFEVIEPLESVKTAHRAILVRNPSDFLTDNPKFFDNTKTVAVIPCFLFETSPSPEGKLKEFKKFQTLLSRLT